MMRLAWKKSQKTLDASKRLHRNKTRSTGSVDIGLTRDQCRCVKPGGTYGGWNVLVSGRLQLGLRFWFPPDPRRRCCSTFLNLNWWKGYCYHKILIMVPRVGDGDPSFPVHPRQMDGQPWNNIQSVNDRAGHEITEITQNGWLWRPFIY